MSTGSPEQCAVEATIATALSVTDITTTTTTTKSVDPRNKKPATPKKKSAPPLTRSTTPKRTPRSSITTASLFRTTTPRKKTSSSPRRTTSSKRKTSPTNEVVVDDPSEEDDGRLSAIKRVRETANEEFNKSERGYVRLKARVGDTISSPVWTSRTFMMATLTKAGLELMHSRSGKTY